jgi:hypothetical protein
MRTATRGRWSIRARRRHPRFALAGGIHDPALTGGIHDPALAGGVHDPALAGGVHDPAHAGGVHDPAHAGGVHDPARRLATTPHGAASFFDPDRLLIERRTDHTTSGTEPCNSEPTTVCRSQ